MESTAGRCRLAAVLQWPLQTTCRIRIIEVPAEIQGQTIARNAGIRRARGQFILATNIDIVFSSELMQFLASRRLEQGRMYRIDRYDVKGGIPNKATIDGQLDHCRKNVIRVYAREGVFPVTAEGFRQSPPEDIADVESGIHFGPGWFPLEKSDTQEPFRWIDSDAYFMARVPEGGAVLVLEAEPGPALAQPPHVLQVLDEADSPVAEWTVNQRTIMKLVVPPMASGDLRFLRLHASGGGRPIPQDPRILYFRLFHCDWSRQAPDEPAPSPLQALTASRPVLMRLLRHRLAPFRKAVSQLAARGRDIFEVNLEFHLGNGWYGLEHSGGERFRWVSTDAELVIRTRESCRLGLLVEPGPGVGFQRFTLIARNANGSDLGRFLVEGVTYFEIPTRVPRGNFTTIIFSVEGGGHTATEDPRTLNFRVFACGGVTGAPSPPVGSTPAAGPWTALMVETRPMNVDWEITLQKYRREIAEMGRPRFLHLNGCGDFTLMSREHWSDIRGYPELDMPPPDLDSLLCSVAHHAGAREELLPEPVRIYHIEHSTESSVPSDGVERLSGLASLITIMRRLHSPVIFNMDNWGLATTALVEDTPDSVLSSTGKGL